MADEFDSQTENEENLTEEAIAAEEASAAVVHSRLQELEGELSASRDRHLRLAAEFDNYRKRTVREQSDAAARAQSALVAKLADVLDDLDRATQHSEASTKEALVEGVELVERKFRQVLEAAGLERVDPRGEQFDPESMEALMSVPTDNPEEDGHVADVFQPGYRLQGMLVRPARVTVKKYEG
jgi:molecular chaperone GrpE